MDKYKKYVVPRENKNKVKMPLAEDLLQCITAVFNNANNNLSEQQTVWNSFLKKYGIDVPHDCHYRA